MTISRSDALREALQDIVDVANISQGVAWYAHIARKALDDDDEEKAKTPKVWTGPDLQRLFNAWREGDNMDSLVARFGRTANAIRQQLHKAKVRRTPQKLREIRLTARRKRMPLL
jgi:hypothetical protein|tara:strand:+ start:39 stop:383 length:345 start_codon:yes stop_codon:yes gene_type:complete